MVCSRFLGWCVLLILVNISSFVWNRNTILFVVVIWHLQSHLHIFFFVFLSFSCSGWSAPCPLNLSCAARAWTTFSSAVTANPAFPRPSSPHLHPRRLLPPSLSRRWPTSALPPAPRPTVPTLRCRRTHRPSVPRCPWPPKASKSLRPSRCSRSRPTVSRSTSSVGRPAASDANTWSKVGQLGWLLQEHCIHGKYATGFLLLSSLPWRK